MIYAYIRVSTDHQCVENQYFEIHTFLKKEHLKADEYIKEVISSRKPLEERQLSCVLSKMKRGDILVATELSRFGRNLLEVMNILKKCLEKGCSIWTLKENYRLSADLHSKVMAFAFSLAGELERQLISQRTKEALIRAKAEGVHLGRPPCFSDKELELKKQQFLTLKDQGFSKTQIEDEMGCSWSTLQRYFSDH